MPFRLISVEMRTCDTQSRGSRVGAVVRALASHQCVPRSHDSRTRRHMWVEFVVGYLLCFERFFSGYSGFPLSSKFQFDLDYCQALNHEPLARVIPQALPVFDIKFTFTFYIYKPATRTASFNDSTKVPKIRQRLQF